VRKRTVSNVPKTEHNVLKSEHDAIREGLLKGTGIVRVSGYCRSSSGSAISVSVGSSRRSLGLPRTLLGSFSSAGCALAALERGRCSNGRDLPAFWHGHSDGTRAFAGFSRSRFSASFNAYGYSACCRAVDARLSSQSPSADDAAQSFARASR
jgi:hypothetical protein